MAENRSIEDALAAAGGPRDLPADLADRLVGTLVEGPYLVTGDEGLFEGIDGPRSIPAPVSASLLAALSPPSPIARTAAFWGMHRRVVAVAAVLVLVLGVVAVAGEGDGNDQHLSASEITTTTRPDRTAQSLPTSATSTTVGTGPTTTAPEATVVAMAESDPAYASLASFASCDELLDWVRPLAVEAADAFGLRIDSGGTSSEVAAPAHPIEPIDPNTPRPPHVVNSVADRSGTNVQEAGVDEPDLVEVGTGALFVLTDTSVHAVLTGPGGPVAGGTITVADPTTRQHPFGMLLDGSRLIVLVQSHDGRPTASVLTIDVSDPSNLVGIDARPVDGAIIDARLSNGVVHVVTTWAPGPFDFAESYEERIDQEAARARHQELLAGSTVEQWVPPSLSCQQVHRPRDLAGFSTTIVTSLPVDGSAVSATAVLADAGTVYATADRLIVSTTRWEYSTTPTDPATFASPTVRTNLHRFAIGGSGPIYLASGSVPGYLRSSYALDEHDGFLRVAATNLPPWSAGAEPAEPSTSSVTVLEQQGDLLVPIGFVGGLGENQQIVGVRFVDDVGFLVTFRRTDPLYTIDLSRPTRPTIRGALEVTGFSGYLHPLGNGLLLGVGTEATETGQRTGGAVSIYDVSDLDHPRLADRAVLPDAIYPAEREPHAVLVSGESGQVVLPATIWSSESNRSRAGFDVFVLTEAGIAHHGRISHEERAPEVLDVAYRVAVADGVLYTVSGAGVRATDPFTLADLGWVPLPLGRPVQCCYSN